LFAKYALIDRGSRYLTWLSLPQVTGTGR